MKNKIAIVFAIGIIANLSNAGGIRDTIDVQLHRDFAHNLGKFKPGSKNIEIFDKKGNSLGVIESLPDFLPNADGGYATAIGHSFVGTADHVEFGKSSIDYGLRYLMSDKGKKADEAKRNENLFNINGEITSQDYVNLVDGRTLPKKELDKGKKLKELVTEAAYQADKSKFGFDYKIARTNHILWQTWAPKLVQESNEIKTGVLLARVGGGVHKLLHDGSETNIGYGWSNGGLNKISRSGKRKASDRYFVFEYTIKKDKNNTPLDSITFPGDSGSPLFIFDEKSKEWQILGFHSGGIGPEGYGKIGQGLWATSVVNEKLKEYINEEIETKSSNNVITLLNKKDDEVKISVDIDASTSEDIFKDKDIILGENGGIINLKNSLDTGSGALIFKGDYSITGDEGDFKTAGYIVEDGKVVKYSRVGKEDEIIRKIGKGTLIIEGKGNSEATINIGEGIVELNRKEADYAAKLIRLASGRATVKLNADNQIKKENGQIGFVFGVRAGTLDLNGQNLEWDNIIHVDDKPIITSTKGESTFTFTGNKHEANLTYLGQFNDGENGKLNVVYKPSDDTHSWSLKGDISSKGKLSVEKGTVHLAAPFEFHALNYVDDTEYLKKTVKFNEIEVKDKATLTVNRNTTLDSQNIELKDGAKLSLKTEGKTSDDKQYADEGAVIKGKVNISSKGVLETKIEDKFSGYLQASLTGEGNVNIDNKDEGKTVLSGDNSKFSGNLSLNTGILEVTTDNALSDSFKNTVLKSGTKLMLDKDLTVSVGNLKAEKGSNILGENNVFRVNNTDTESYIYSKFEGVNKLIKDGIGTLKTDKLEIDNVTVEKGILSLDEIKSKNTIIEKDGNLELEKKIDGDILLKGKLILGKSRNEKQEIEISGNLDADNGTILFDSELEKDDSKTDVLNIKGNANGNATVEFNYTGKGDKTIKGIPLVKIEGDSNLNLSHKGRVVAGAYEYKLEKNSDGNWILQSTDALRPEIGSYLANAYISNQNLKIDSVLDHIDTYKENDRKLHIYGNVSFPKYKNVKVEDKDNQLSVDINAIKEKVGVDLKISNNYVGVFYETSKANGQSTSKEFNISSKNEVKSSIFGGYFAHFANEDRGIYFASTIKVGNFNNNIYSAENVEYSHIGLSAGGEVGYTIPVANNVYVRPKVNISYINFGKTKIEDKASTVDIYQSNVVSRAETELIAKNDSFDTKLGVFYEVGSPVSIKLDDVKESIKNTSKVVGVKLNSKYNVTKNLSLNGELKYSLSSEKHSEGDMKIGVDFNF